MNKILCVTMLSTLLFTSQSWATIPTDVYYELSKFTSSRGEHLSQEYIKMIPGLIEQKTLADEQLKLAIDTKGACVEKMDITYFDSLSQSSEKSAKEFESGFVKIDASFCLPRVNGERLLKTSNNLDFRKKAFKTIKDTYGKGDLNCEITSAPTIGMSNYCYKMISMFSEDYSTILSYNVWNDSDEKYDSPVFFRSVFESAHQVQNQTSFHVISYVRANKLSTLQRIFAKSFIIDNQKIVFKKLKEELN